MSAIHRNLRVFMTAIIVSTILVGCSTDHVLNVENPDIIDPNALNNPQGVGAQYAGAVSEVVFQMDNNFGLAIASALFTDEAMHASTPPATREWDLRNVQASN